MISNHELFENTVATFVDIASVMIAYTIGIREASFELGLVYGVFDAFVVVWLRKPIAGAVRSATRFRRDRLWKSDVYVADV